MTTAKELFSLRASSFQDDRTRLSILPAAVKLVRGKICGAESLLSDQPEQAVLGRKAGCRLENAPGEGRAGILLDFGRETHGALRLTAAAAERESGRVLFRIRFGESVMEALTPLGEKNTTNDHAVRDHVYDLGPLSTVEINESGFALPGWSWKRSRPR